MKHFSGLANAHVSHGMCLYENMQTIRTKAQVASMKGADLIYPEKSTLLRQGNVNVIYFT